MTRLRLARRTTPALAALGILLFAAESPAQTPGNWTLEPRQINPSPRSIACLAYDSAHGQVVMSGGTIFTSNSDFSNSTFSYLNDTWVWGGTFWTQVSTPNVYPVFGACAYDSAHGQLVMFTGVAGLINTSSSDQTWLFDGANWTQASPKTEPPTRGGFAMAYDSAHGQVVLFGGVGNTELQDTWTWDGTNWTQMSPLISPPARDSHAMAYDSIHGQVVVFGGESTNFSTYNVTNFNDTWTWDGANWTQQAPQNSPPVRNYFSLAFDAAHGQTVLFGGFDVNSNALGDTWTWDGANWTRQMPQTSPVAAAGTGMAFDAVRGQVVLFGGQDNPLQLDYFNNSAVWSEGASSITQPAITTVIRASGFGGLPTITPGSWIEIYGYDLASTTREWGIADFNGNDAPISLSGVKVSIGGQPAVVEYISSGSPGQVNAQVPDGVATGTELPLTLTNGTSTSQNFSVMVNNAPGLLAPAAFQISGSQYVVALFSDGTYVLPTGAIPGVASRPAKPGEPIVLYGIGFGPTTPSSPAGQIVTLSNNLSQPFEISIGGVQAALNYWGLSPGYVGLYQFNVVVPQVPANDLVPLTFTLGGVPGVQTLYVAVQQ